MGVLSNFRRRWNLFLANDVDEATAKLEAQHHTVHQHITSTNPLRLNRPFASERSVISAITGRISTDISYGFDFMHVKVDENDQYQKRLHTSLDRCLSLEANLDQTGPALISDIVISMFDEGVVAVVPTVTDDNPLLYQDNSVGIHQLRTAKIVEWSPYSVGVEIYNDLTGNREYMKLPKNRVAIIENPLYEIMNQPNSTMKRLIEKLSLLDTTDSDNATGKRLDLIIQLPYAIKSTARQIQAENRRKLIEDQLISSKYGIAYVDSTEKIIQLNRSVENNLSEQVEYLTTLLYSQLGITESIFKGTATEKELLTYYDRTVEPIVKAIATELERKFLSKTAYTQGHRIRGFRDVFKLTTATEISEMADSLSRNEIVSPNEFRGFLGFKPSPNPDSDVIRNRNMPGSINTPPNQTPSQTDLESEDYETLFNEALDKLEEEITALTEGV